MDIKTSKYLALKATGAIIRPRAKYYEEGKKNQVNQVIKQCIDYK